jgi:cystathionine gamma-synthase
VAFSSGQAATTALLTPLAAGATVVFPQDAYTGTRGLLTEFEQRGALSLRPVDVTDTDAVLAALDGARMLWLESPTNPMLGVADLSRLLEAAHAARVFSVVDNTPCVARSRESWRRTWRCAECGRLPCECASSPPPRPSWPGG